MTFEEKTTGMLQKLTDENYPVLSIPINNHKDGIRYQEYFQARGYETKIEVTRFKVPTFYVFNKSRIDGNDCECAK